MSTIHVDVVSAEESIFSGEAKFVALPGEAGELGIYPRHTPLITRIRPGSVRITTADGKRLWITHGDLFDGVIQCARWLAFVGDAAYEFMLRMNRHLNHLRARLGLPYWSLSKYLKLKVKRAVSYVSDFEGAVAREARKRGVDGVVCGHIHHAEMRMIDGVLYCNDGDWVESLTALVEHPDGRLEIIDRSACRSACGAAQAQLPLNLTEPA